MYFIHIMAAFGIVLRCNTMLHHIAMAFGKTVFSYFLKNWKVKLLLGSGLAPYGDSYKATM